MKYICTLTLLLLAQATYAADATPVPDPYGGPDKRPEKSENVTGYLNEDGSSTTTAVIIYADGHKEFCITQMVRPTADPRRWKVTGEKCTRILSYLK
jgi:hypothetical protein